jgi:hypothetical protein
MSEVSKKYVHCESLDTGHSVSGRLLGLIDDAEFFNLVKNKKLRKKAFSAETKPLEEIAKGYVTLDGLRLVLAKKRENGRKVMGKELFVSQKLTMIAEVPSSGGGLAVIDEDDDYLVLEEKLFE